MPPRKKKEVRIKQKSKSVYVPMFSRNGNELQDRSPSLGDELEFEETYWGYIPKRKVFVTVKEIVTLKTGK